EGRTGALSHGQGGNHSLPDRTGGFRGPGAEGEPECAAGGPAESEAVRRERYVCEETDSVLDHGSGRVSRPGQHRSLIGKGFLSRPSFLAGVENGIGVPVLVRDRRRPSKDRLNCRSNAKQPTQMVLPES